MFERINSLVRDMHWFHLNTNWTCERNPIKTRLHKIIKHCSWNFVIARVIAFTNRTNCTRLIEIFLFTRFVLSILPNRFRFTLTTNTLCTLPIYFTNLNVARQETIEFGVTECRTTSNVLCDCTRAIFFGQTRL